jgi:hypothetical protein
MGHESRLTSTKDFVVSTAAPLADGDLSTAARFRFFDATLAWEGNVPVVSIAFDTASPRRPVEDIFISGGIFTPSPGRAAQATY